MKTVPVFSVIALILLMIVAILTEVNSKDSSITCLILVCGIGFIGTIAAIQSKK